MTPVLEVKNITKRFGSLIANDHINLTLNKGQVLGLLGENGAGKSTLMNLIYGLYSPDEGEIRVHGKAVKITNPNDAIRLGIGMVHQHFQLVDVLTVTENIMLGNESVMGPFLRRAVAKKRILELAQRYDLPVNADERIENLPVGVQQRVEILKALYRNADILILDEPSAVLTPQETLGLFKVMRALIANGVSIIFISHKLKEILEICDQVVVLRHGKVAGEADPRTATEQSLASLMVGRDVLLKVEKAEAQPKERVLHIRELCVKDERDQLAVDHLSLEVFAGEILGIAGVQGNGQTQLIEALTGLRGVQSGNIYLLDQDMSHATPRRITESGVGHVPEDRQKMGMIASFPIMSNLVLCTYHGAPFARGLVIDDPAIEHNALELVERFDVRPRNIYADIGGLSGGNQQKVIIAREFSRRLKLLIAAQPTRGLDVGSIEFIHSQIIKMRDEGTAVLLISTELDEILNLSDRVAVMYDGSVIDTLPIASATRERIGLLMAGIKTDPTLNPM